MICFCFSNAMWLEICYDNLCVDLHMIMHKFWYFVTWPSLQLEYEPAFPGRVATFASGVKNIYNYFENLPANTIRVSKHFGSLLSLWFFYNGMRTRDHRSQKQMNLKRWIQAIDWKESMWPKSAFYKRRLLILFWISGFR